MNRWRREKRAWAYWPHWDALLAVIFVLAVPSTAFAYIDPGTGSALLYVVTGIMLSLYFGARALYYRMLEFAHRGKSEHQRCNVAIHSEEPRYEITFRSMIHALASRGIEVAYFTMYERDSSFEPLPEGVTHKVIGEGLLGYSYLNNLEANILVTTTPQLDVMTFRRSKRVKHYCHVPHALADSSNLRPFAYDYFDSVFCCGVLLKENIRRMEEIRSLPAKELFETGVPHYDALLESVPEPEADPRQPTILIAPSWGPLSLFESFGTGFVHKIAERYDVIVRPHPQLCISNPELYAEVTALKGVTVDTERTPAVALAKADLLISGVSGIMHEFAFIYESPVIIIDRKIENSGLEGELLGDSELIERCREIIIAVAPGEIENVVERIDEILGAYSRGETLKLRDDLVYNFGSAGSAAAEQIEGILACQ